MYCNDTRGTGFNYCLNHMLIMNTACTLAAYCTRTAALVQIRIDFFTPIQEISLQQLIHDTVDFFNGKKRFFLLGLPPFILFFTF